MNHWIYDIETLPNATIFVFEHYKTDERKIFVIHELRNDMFELYDFLDECEANGEWHISYNGIAFDSQVVHYMRKNIVALRGLPLIAYTTAANIYQYAQKIIDGYDKNTGVKHVPYMEKEFKFKQIDLYKLNHWDSPAKRSSLKWIQFGMDWPNLQNMPIHHTTEITTLAQLDVVIQYCINDVRSTKAIFNRCKEQIKLRASLSREYDINLWSASEPKISRELFLHFLSEKVDINKWDLRQMRTNRTTIEVKDIILDYIKFTKLEFRQLLMNFNNLVIDARNTKSSFKYSVKYRGVKTDFGLGGLHGATEPGVYKSDEKTVIMTSDVTSFYPNLAIRNKWAPAHLPQKAFCDQYEWFFEERKKIPKKDPKNYVYKIILNSTYGLSNDENSFLYDPEFTMRVTINGQLSLAMLYEMICEGIPDAIPLLQNTDGLETMIPRSCVDKYMEICKKWERITNLELEHDQYQKLILADVNNYIAVHDYKECTAEDFEEYSTKEDVLLKREGDKYFCAKTKCKGRFEFTDLALHKNKSFLVIPKAIFNYFVFGKSPEYYVANNHNIFDYCGAVKANGDWVFEERRMHEGDLVKLPMQSTIRYYVSVIGGKLYKVNKADGREQVVQSGKWQQVVLNEVTDREKHVDSSYYIQKVWEEINGIERKTSQLKLF